MSLLRRAQFPEDAGPLAHPVRPAQYSEINNFYTATVYEKGAELVRMLAGRLGPEGFRRGMDRYFERNDGRAATLEDFLAALGEANGTDLTPYLAWYGQAGTPRAAGAGPLRRGPARVHADPEPSTPRAATARGAPAAADPGQAGAVHPRRRHAAAAAGRPDVQSWQRTGGGAGPGRSRTSSSTDVDAAPVPSLLRGFSAPVILECDYTPAELALLLAHDADGFNRWEAGQRLAARAYEDLRDGTSGEALQAWCDALVQLFDDGSAEDALLADLLTPPGEIELAERESAVDPQRIHVLRQELQRQLAEQLGADALGQRYRSLAAHTTIALDAPGQARRRLKRRVLELLELGDADQARQLAAAQYRDAPGMTDRLAALAVLARGASDQASGAGGLSSASTPATRWRWTSGSPCRPRCRANPRCHACSGWSTMPPSP